MAVSKVILNGETLMDVTVDTVTSEKLLTGYQATGRDGVKVQGAYVPQSVELAVGSADPSESAQHITPPSGYDGFEYFDIGAVSSDYVGSNIAQRSSSDLTASGSKVTVPSGYYAAVATKAVSAGSATTPATTITSTPTITVSAAGLITATVNSSKSITPTVSAGYISSGTAGTVTASGSNTSQLSTQSATTITPTESTQTAVASGKYTTGIVKVAAIPSDYIGSAIASVEVNEGITTVSGSTATRGDATWSAGIIAAGNMGAATFANSSSGQTQYVDISNTTEAPVLVSGGYLYINKGYTDDLKISLAKLVPDGASASLASGVILSGYAAYDNDGNLVAGNIPTKSSTNVSASGSTVTVPSGYYATQVTKDIDAGSVTIADQSLTLNPIWQVSNSGLIKLQLSTGRQVSPAVTSGYVAAVPSFSVEASLNTSYQLDIQAATTITPTESTQTAVASGKYTTGTITVEAISSNYVGSNIPARSSSNLSASGSIVTAAAGYYANAASKAVAAGTATTPAITITANPGISVDSSTGVITATTASSKSITPTISAGYINTGTAGTVTVSGTTSSALSIQAAATINPTESEQTAVAAGKYTTGVVKVGAIPSDYIGSNIAQNSAADVVAAGPTVTIPSGYYGVEVSKEISSATFATQLTLTAGPNITLNSATGLITGTNNIFSKQNPLTISGYADKDTQIWITTQGSKTLQLDTLAATTYTPSTSTQIISSGVYLTGAQTIAGDTALVASNIIQGATIFGVVGTAKTQPTLQSKTVIPSSTSQVITFDSNYDGLSSVTIEAIPISVIEHRLVLPDGLIGV